MMIERGWGSLRRHYRAWPRLFWLLAICWGGRLFFWLTYRPVTYSDSERYFFIAGRFAAGDLTGYQGIRPPVYPLLIMLTGMGRYWFYFIWLGQSLAALVTIGLLFLMIEGATGQQRIAFWSSLAFGLSLHHIFYEAAMLTESLSTFGLTVAIYSWFRWGASRRLGWLLLLSVVMGLLGLTRPVLVTLLPVMALFTWQAGRQTGARVGEAQLSLWVPALLLVSGWSLFNYQQVGYLGPTTLTGFNLSNHSGGFMERADDADAVLRDIYLAYRPAQIGRRGHHAMTIYQAIPEMQAATGYDIATLSRAMTRLSLKLFWQHPGLYLGSVFQAWLAYWHKANVWVPGALRLALLARPLELLWQGQRLLLYAADLSLLTFVGWIGLRRRRMPLIFWHVLTLFLTLSVVQAFLEFGENARYSIPAEPMGWFLLALSATVVWPRRVVGP